MEIIYLLAYILLSWQNFQMKYQETPPELVIFSKNNYLYWSDWSHMLKQMGLGRK